MSGLQSSLTVKSIQTGSAAAAGAGTSTNVTISAVDISKTIVNFLGHDGPRTNSTVDHIVRCSVRLVNSTTVECRVPSSTFGGLDAIFFQVVEFV